MTVIELMNKLKDAEVMFVDGTLKEYVIKDVTKNEKGDKVALWKGEK
jgi:hypothetical protein